MDLVKKGVKTLSKKVNTDKREIYSKSANFFDTLKIIAFSIDLVKGFVVSLIKIFTTSYIIKCVTISDEAREIAALVIASFILWLIVHILACRKCIEDKEKTETANDLKEYEIISYGFSNFLMVGAIMCYFVGDNLKNFYKIEERPKSFRIASQILLIVGALAMDSGMCQYSRDTYTSTTIEMQRKKQRIQKATCPVKKPLMKHKNLLTLTLK